MLYLIIKRGNYRYKRKKTNKTNTNMGTDNNKVNTGRFVAWVKTRKEGSWKGCRLQSVQQDLDVIFKNFRRTHFLISFHLSYNNQNMLNDRSFSTQYVLIYTL